MKGNAFIPMKYPASIATKVVGTKANDMAIEQRTRVNMALYPVVHPIIILSLPSAQVATIPLTVSGIVVVNIEETRSLVFFFMNVKLVRSDIKVFPKAYY